VLWKFRTGCPRVRRWREPGAGPAGPPAAAAGGERDEPAHRQGDGHAAGSDDGGGGPPGGEGAREPGGEQRGLQDQVGPGQRDRQPARQPDGHRVGRRGSQARGEADPGPGALGHHAGGGEQGAGQQRVRGGEQGQRHEQRGGQDERLDHRRRPGPEPDGQAPECDQAQAEGRADVRHPDIGPAGQAREQQAVRVEPDLGAQHGGDAQAEHGTADDQQREAPGEGDVPDHASTHGLAAASRNFPSTLVLGKFRKGGRVGAAGG
jgi:hypothetical protein